MKFIPGNTPTGIFERYVGKGWVRSSAEELISALAAHSKDREKDYDEMIRDALSGGSGEIRLGGFVYRWRKSAA